MIRKGYSMTQLHRFPGMSGWKSKSFISFILFQLVAGDVKEIPLNSTGTTESRVMVESDDFDKKCTPPAVDEKCTPPAVDDFPPDGLDAKERLHGWIVIHLLIAFYVTGALAIVCDTYFVPVMNVFSERLKLPSDVAGATFMALGTSCPELFVALIGAFITEGDIGVGAVIGSAVFNVLAIVSVCGICAGTVVAVNWRPLTRDCVVYLIAVGSLYFFIKDGEINWYEATILVGEYVAYIFILYLNAKFQKHCRGPLMQYDIPSVENDTYNLSDTDSYISTVSTISQEYNELRMYSTKINMDQLKNAAEIAVRIVIPPSEMKDVSDVYQQEKLSVSSSTVTEKSVVWNFPDDGRLSQIIWILWWPMRFLYHITIPGVKDDVFSILSVLTFAMSVAYIAALTYMATWMVSIIGYTIHVPDSVMGLTFIALGNSLPEIISSIIVSRQSLGNMALSNAMGGNLFALLMCLGAPWIAKSAVSEDGFVKIYSTGLTYSVLTLLIAVVLMFLVIAANRFKLDKKVGIICLVLYIAYLTFSCLHEMNYFGMVNFPMCRISVS